MAETAVPARLTRLPSWLAAQVAREAHRLVAEQLGREGLRRQDFSVLTALAETGPLSQAELGRRLWIDRSDLHTLLNELEAGGLVERSVDAQDRRRKLVGLTRAGAATLRRLDARVDAAQEALLAPLAPADRRTLVRLLAALAEGHGATRRRSDR